MSMDPHTPSSPLAEDVQENPRTNETPQADESSRAAPNTVQHPRSAPAQTVVASAPRRGKSNVSSAPPLPKHAIGPTELNLDNDPYADQNDRRTQPGRRQPRTHRTQGTNIPSARRDPDRLDANPNTVETAIARRHVIPNPRAMQSTLLEQQMVQGGNYNYLPPLTSMGNFGNAGQVGSGAVQRLDVTPRNMHPARGTPTPGAGPRQINPRAHVPSQPFPGYMDQHPIRSGIQRDENVARYQVLHPSQQTPHPQDFSGRLPQIQPGSQYFVPPPPQWRPQPTFAVVPPGDTLRRMQPSQQQAQQGNFFGTPYGPQFLPGFTAPGHRLPESLRPATYVGQTRDRQGTVLPGQYTQGSSNQRPTSSLYGQAEYYSDAEAISDQESAEFTGSRIVRPQMVPSGPLRPVRRHPPRVTPSRHRRIREEDSQRRPKRRRHEESESSHASRNDSPEEAETRRQSDEAEDKREGKL